MVKIKVCGITNLEDAIQAVELGVDALGFIFSDSPRKLPLEKAKDIIKSIPPFIFKVGVFSNEPVDFVRKVDEFLSLDFLQFHGDEPPEYVSIFKEKGIKAFKVKDESIIQTIKKYNSRFFILDSEDKGKPFNWNIAVKAKDFGIFLLGGGLNPENVELALLRVSPFGVDVCSGVEASLGKKDPVKLRDFVWRVKRWENR